MKNNRLLRTLQKTVSEDEIFKLSNHTLPHISEFNRSGNAAGGIADTGGNFGRKDNCSQKYTGKLSSNLSSRPESGLEMDYIVLCLSLFYMPQTATSAGNGSLYYCTGQQSDNILLPYEICER